MSKNEITVDNLAPMKRIIFPILEDGGIVVLRGPNGSGKSRTLDAIQIAVTGEGTIKQDAPAKGTVQVGDDITLTIGQRMRRTTKGGKEAVVTSISGKFDPSTFVEPGMKDPVAADKRRIECLLALSGGSVDISAFRDLAHSDAAVNALVDWEKVTDPIALQQSIKRGFEARAREREDVAKGLLGQVEALQAQNNGVVMDAPYDEAELSAAHEQAIRELAKGEEKAMAVEAAGKRADAARSMLEAAEDPIPPEEPGLTVADCERRLDDATRFLDEAAEAARLRIAEAERVVQEAERFLQQRRQSAEHAAQLASSRQTALDAIAAAEDMGTAPDLQALQQAVTCTKEANIYGSLVRGALINMETMDDLIDKSAEVEEEVIRLRADAKGTETVLSAMVNTLDLGLSVVDGRLVTPTDRGKNTLLSELSPGERYRIAIGAWIAAGRPGGILPMSQEGWEGLDGSNRRELLALAREHKITVYAAACDDGDVRVEEFEG